MNPRERFLSACRCEPTQRPALWLLGQAGEYLPEFRQLRAAHTLEEILKTPELAAAASVQPLERFGLDAALLFSDWRLVADAMGQPSSLGESGARRAAFSVSAQADIERLDLRDLELKLATSARALRLIRRQIGPKRALIGYATTPWALAAYMAAGEAPGDCRGAKRLFYLEPTLFDRLARRATQALARYLQLQLAAGVDAIYLDDPSSDKLGPDALLQASAAWTRRLIGSIKGQAPVILSARGLAHPEVLAATSGAAVLAPSAGARLATLRQRVPAHIALMGNLDAALLSLSEEVVEAEARRILSDMRPAQGHLFNVARALPDDAKPEIVAHLLKTVRDFH